MSTETLSPPSVQPWFPEVETNSDTLRQRWETDMALAQRALEYPEGFEYEAQLPICVGFVPEEEQSAFDNFMANDFNDQTLAELQDHKAVDALKLNFPQTYRIILNDLRNLGIQPGLMQAVLEHRKIGPQTPVRATAPHIDFLNENDVMAGVTQYIFSNFQTWFMEGPTVVGYKHDWIFRGMFELKQLKPDQAFVQPSPYSIFRLSPLVPHTSPESTQEGTRTWGSVTVGQREVLATKAYKLNMRKMYGLK